MGRIPGPCIVRIEVVEIETRRVVCREETKRGLDIIWALDIREMVLRAIPEPIERIDPSTV